MNSLIYHLNRSNVLSTPIWNYHTHKWIKRFIVNYGIRNYSNGQANLTVDENALLLEDYLGHFASGKSKGDFLRVLNPKAAAKFAQLIMAVPVENAAYTMEINAAPGLLTEKLMDAGFSAINLYEEIQSAHCYLEPIMEKYPDRVHLKRVGFYYLWNLIMNDWMNNTNHLDDFFGHLEKRDWKDDPFFHIIGATRSFQIIAQMIVRTVFQNGLASYGRIALHLAVPVSLWNKVSCQNNDNRFYNTSTAMYNILFEHQILGILPRSAFHPRFIPPSKGTYANKRHLIYDKDSLCVIRIESKRDLFDETVRREDMPKLYYFIKHHMKKRVNKIIPEIEKWMPGCGRYLIEKGYTIHDQFGELLPDELVKLFKLFKSLPGYDSSSFVTMVDQFPQTMDENIVFGDNPSETIDEMFKISRELINSETTSEVSQNPERNPSIHSNHL